MSPGLPHLAPSQSLKNLVKNGLAWLLWGPLAETTPTIYLEASGGAINSTSKETHQFTQLGLLNSATRGSTDPFMKSLMCPTQSKARSKHVCLLHRLSVWNPSPGSSSSPGDPGTPQQEIHGITFHSWGACLQGLRKSLLWEGRGGGVCDHPAPK